MGFYINVINGNAVPSRGKVDFLLNNVEGSKKISPPIQWEENLVCVVNNGAFEAAAYAYSKEEMDVFLYHTGDRPTQWLTVPNAKEYAQ